jgi:hypothetical protein
MATCQIPRQNVLVVYLVCPCNHGEPFPWHHFIFGEDPLEAGEQLHSQFLFTFVASDDFIVGGEVLSGLAISPIEQFTYSRNPSSFALGFHSQSPQLRDRLRRVRAG